MSDLAINGGEPTIKSAAPHFVWPKITKETQAAVVSQLEDEISIPDASGVFSVFEREFSEFHNRKLSVLFNSGTSALYAAFVSLQLKKGDNVIVPDYTFFATTSPLIYFPVDIRFSDCGHDGNMTLNNIVQLVDESTRAIIITHMWGMPCDLRAISNFCRDKGITLIEDCSHAHGARIRDELCGSIGDIAVWSLQGQKIVTGGEGGILVTDSTAYHNLAVLAGHYGPLTKNTIPPEGALAPFRTTGFGMKLRAHPLAIAIALQQFRLLDEFLEIKRRFAAQLYQLLAGYSFIQLPDISEREPSWYSFTFRVNDPAGRFSVDQLYEALVAEGCIEFDRPGSTRDISSYPIFQEQHPEYGFAAWSTNAKEDRNGAQAYFNEAIKLPVWASENDRPIFEAYLSAIMKVCDEFESRVKK